MNKERRKRIRDEVIHHLDMAINALEEIKEEEEEYAESIPYSFDARREAAEEVVAALDDIKENVETEKNNAADLIGDAG